MPVTLQYSATPTYLSITQQRTVRRTELITQQTGMSLQAPATTPTTAAATATTAIQHEIAIFWDLLNVPLPVGMSASATAKAIVDAVSSYVYHGRIIDRRLYCDFTTATAAADATSSTAASAASTTTTTYKQQHSLLQDAAGFDLVPTTRRRQHDKRLCADIWTFCWDSAARNGDPCVVLLTNDGDYAYMLAKLRDRGMRSVCVCVCVLDWLIE